MDPPRWLRGQGIVKISLPGPVFGAQYGLKHLIEKEILKQSAIRVEIFPVFSRTAGNFGHRFARLSSRDLERSAVPG